MNQFDGARVFNFSYQNGMLKTEDSRDYSNVAWIKMKKSGGISKAAKQIS